MLARWRNWLKGIYDTQHEKHELLVTGSARFDVYRRGGDSLLGRYHYWRLHLATHLLKRIQYCEDSEGYRYDLRYVRDKVGREVDFVIVRDGSVAEPWEAKWSDSEVSKSLRY